MFLRRGMQAAQNLPLMDPAKAIAVMMGNPAVRKAVELKLGRAVRSPADIVKSGLSIAEVAKAAFSAPFFSGMPVYYSVDSDELDLELELASIYPDISPDDRAAVVDADSTTRLVDHSHVEAEVLEQLKSLTGKRFYFGEHIGEKLTTNQANMAKMMTRGTSTEEVNILGVLQAFVADDVAAGFDGSLYGVYRDRREGEDITPSLHKSYGGRISTTTTPHIAHRFAKGGWFRGRPVSAIYSIAPFLISPALMVAEDVSADLDGVFQGSDMGALSYSYDGNDQEFTTESEVSLAGVVPGFLIPFSTATIGPLPSGKVMPNPDYIDAAVILLEPELLHMFGEVMDLYQRMHNKVPLREISLGQVEATPNQLQHFHELNLMEGQLQLTYQSFCNKLEAALEYDQVKSFVQAYVKSTRGKPFSSYAESLLEAWKLCERHLKRRGSGMCHVLDNKGKRRDIVKKEKPSFEPSTAKKTKPSK
ncbi:MAG: hypothetical protein CMF48_05735 [Legionellales bacterium]|nr:hypothetical protein [Legionellales bacterium]